MKVLEGGPDATDGGAELAAVDPVDPAKDPALFEEARRLRRRKRRRAHC